MAQKTATVEPGDLCLYNLLLPENAGHGLGRFSPFRQPVECPFPIDVDLCGIDDGIILSEDFEKPAISGSALLDYDNPVIGTFLGPNTGQSNCYQMVSLLHVKKPYEYKRDTGH
jgi:hypothetical protein